MTDQQIATIESSLHALITSATNPSFAHPVLIDLFISNYISPTVAAVELFTVCSSSSDPQKAASNLGSFLWETAVDLPVVRDRIAELVVYLDATASGIYGDIVPTSSTPQEAVNATKAGLWNQFHEEVGELLRARDNDCSESKENARQWIGLNTFLAQCSKHGDAIFPKEKHGDRYVSAGDGLMALSSLEEPLERAGTSRDEAIVDVKVPAAAAWMLEAGDLMLQESKEFGNRASVLL